MHSTVCDARLGLINRRAFNEGTCTYALVIVFTEDESRAGKEIMIEGPNSCFVAANGVSSHALLLKNDLVVRRMNGERSP